ncbi:MAG TPA: hypothetical protein PKD84_05035 [Propionicimonas sp.]|jgi:hypothetical protein|nr:hypothetical protein [Propionicimonas sp.]
MELLEGYIELLMDELAPYGLEFEAVAVTPETGWREVTFRADPDSFLRRYPELGLAELYGDEWPPAGLYLRLRINPDGDPTQLEFENTDLMAQTASVDPQLRVRLNTMNDPADHAMAVGQALGLALAPVDEDNDYFFE